MSHEEAVNSTESEEWQAAMQKEMSALVENDTFDYSPKPSQKIVDGRWVYAKKSDEGNREIFKARYVAKGFSQVKDID